MSSSTFLGRVGDGPGNSSVALNRIIKVKSSCINTSMVPNLKMTSVDNDTAKHFPLHSKTLHVAGVFSRSLSSCSFLQQAFLEWPPKCEAPK